MKAVVEKRCTKCGKSKPLKEFNRQARNKDGLRYWCCDCDRAAASRYYQSHQTQQKVNRSAYYQANQEHVLTLQRQAHLRWRYRITSEQYEALLAQQNGCCAICGTPTPGGQGRFHVDHDHACCPSRNSCGHCIRGLLCVKCNQKLGVIESPFRQMAEIYLEATPCKSWQ